MQPNTHETHLFEQCQEVQIKLTGNFVCYMFMFYIYTPQLLRLYMKTTNVALVEVGFLSKSCRLVLVSKKYSKLKF